MSPCSWKAPIYKLLTTKHTNLYWYSYSETKFLCFSNANMEFLPLSFFTIVWTMCLVKGRLKTPMLNIEQWTNPQICWSTIFLRNVVVLVVLMALNNRRYHLTDIWATPFQSLSKFRYTFYSHSATGQKEFFFLGISIHTNSSDRLLILSLSLKS